MLVITIEVEQTSIAYFANEITYRLKNRRDTAAAGWRVSIFYKCNKSGSKVHISGLLYSLLQRKKGKLLACVQGVRGWGGRGDGALARRQADCWLYRLVCFFFLVSQPQKSKKITTATTKENTQVIPSNFGPQFLTSYGADMDTTSLPRRWELPSRASRARTLTRPIYKICK